MTSGNNTNPSAYIGSGKQAGFSVGVLFSLVNNATVSAKQKLTQIQNNKSAISIGDMFEMQMLMNHLSQLSEMSSDVVAATNSAIQRMAQNVKS
jgi:hypothetical protein